MHLPVSRQAAIICHILICTFFLSGVFSLADAYVLKGEHVLQLMIEKNNLPKRLGIFQTVSFFDPEVDFMTTDYDEKVFCRIPGEFRSEIATADFQRVHVVASGRSVTIVNGQLVSTSETWTDQYKDLFCFRDRKQLVEKLQTLRINFSVTSLGRYQGTICYVLGADYPDETVPQLWVSKDTFRPVRWIIDAADVDGVRVQREILYQDWQSYSRSWYPSRIEFMEDRQPVKRISVGKIATNPSFSNDLFDVDRLESIYAPRYGEEKKPEDRNDISHQIEEFKKIYE